MLKFEKVLRLYTRASLNKWHIKPPDDANSEYIQYYMPNYYSFKKKQLMLIFNDLTQNIRNIHEKNWSLQFTDIYKG